MPFQHFKHHQAWIIPMEWESPDSNKSALAGRTHKIPQDAVPWLPEEPPCHGKAQRDGLPEQASIPYVDREPPEPFKPYQHPQAHL